MSKLYCASGWHHPLVKDGACVTQRAGLNGAKQFIDSIAKESK